MTNSKLTLLLCLLGAHYSAIRTDDVVLNFKKDTGLSTTYTINPDDTEIKIIISGSKYEPSVATHVSEMNKIFIQTADDEATPYQEFSIFYSHVAKHFDQIIVELNSPMRNYLNAEGKKSLIFRI